MRTQSVAQGIEIGQLTDVSHCKLQQYLKRNRFRALQQGARDPSGPQRRSVAMRLGSPPTGHRRNDMNTTAPTRPAALHRHCVLLTAGPAAAAEARGRVRAAICTWDVRVD